MQPSFRRSASGERERLLVAISCCAVGRQLVSSFMSATEVAKLGCRYYEDEHWSALAGIRWTKEAERDETGRQTLGTLMDR